MGDLLGALESMEWNRLANEAMTAVVDRFARRVNRSGALGPSYLALLVDGDSAMVEAADVEALHLWAFALRVPVDKLAAAIQSRAETLRAGEP